MTNVAFGRDSRPPAQTQRTGKYCEIDGWAVAGVWQFDYAVMRSHNPVGAACRLSEHSIPSAAQSVEGLRRTTLRERSRFLLGIETLNE